MHEAVAVFPFPRRLPSAHVHWLFARCASLGEAEREAWRGTVGVYVCVGLFPQPAEKPKGAIPSEQERLWIRLPVTRTYHWRGRAALLYWHRQAEVEVPPEATEGRNDAERRRVAGFGACALYFSQQRYRTAMTAAHQPEDVEYRLWDSAFAIA